MEAWVRKQLIQHLFVCLLYFPCFHTATYNYTKLQRGNEMNLPSKHKQSNHTPNQTFNKQLQLIGTLFINNTSYFTIFLNNTASGNRKFNKFMSLLIINVFTTYLFPLYKIIVGGFRFGSNLQACSDKAIPIPDILGFILPLAI